MTLPPMYPWTVDTNLRRFIITTSDELPSFILQKSKTKTNCPNRLSILALIFIDYYYKRCAHILSGFAFYYSSLLLSWLDELGSRAHGV